MHVFFPIFVYSFIWKFINSSSLNSNGGNSTNTHVNLMQWKKWKRIAKKKNRIERRALIYCEWETSRKQFNRPQTHTQPARHQWSFAQTLYAKLEYHVSTLTHTCARARSHINNTNNNNEIYEEAQLFHSTRQRIAHNLQANEKKWNMKIKTWKQQLDEF